MYSLYVVQVHLGRPTVEWPSRHDGYLHFPSALCLRLSNVAAERCSSFRRLAATLGWRRRRLRLPIDELGGMRRREPSFRPRIPHRHGRLGRRSCLIRPLVRSRGFGDSKGLYSWGDGRIQHSNAQLCSSVLGAGLFTSTGIPSLSYTR